MENAVAHGAILRREEPLRGLQAARPMSRLEEAQQRPADQQTRIALDPAGDESGRRPEQYHRRIEAAHRNAVRQDSEDERADGKGPAKNPFQVAVLFLVKFEFVGNANRDVRQRLPVHVIDHGGEQEQSAKPPFPMGWPLSGRPRHPSQPFPSHAITRSSSATTSPAKTRNNVSPFSAVAR